MPDKDFDVVITSDLDKDTVVLTSKEKAEKWLSEALDKYDPKNSQYSAVLKDGFVSSYMLTPDLLDSLSDSPQSNLNSILQINSIVRREINKNDLIGITSTSIENNINTSYKLSYRDFADQRNKQKAKKKAELFINDFNEQINLRKLIRNSISGTFDEGNYCICLRRKENSYIVDYYPLGVAVISDYEINGEPVLLINIRELTNRLQKTMIKNKKGKAIFFDSIKEEIRANYPPEVYNAFINKEEFARLDVRYSGVMRTGNLRRKYGLTPFFRALYPVSMLDTFGQADRVNTKAKSKKIIVQLLNEKLIGESGDKDAFEEMAYAHENLMEAWRMPTVVVTPPAYVKEIKYVEPSSDMTNIDTVNQYRNRVMTCLGIGFLSQEGKQTVSTANISVDQLMLNINKIAEQLEDILYKWYQNILVDNGFDKNFAPKIDVIDAEQMSFEVKKSLADMLYSKLGASYRTVYETMGLDIDEERNRREVENSEDYDEIFSPHPTSYTISDNADNENPKGNIGGRPRDKNSKNPDKQNYDKTRVNSK